MSDQSKVNRADAQFKKLQRAEEGKKGLSEYEAERAAVRAKTERLRALRLAHESELAAAAPVPQAASAPAKKSAKAKKGASGTLSDWMKAQKDGGRNN